MPDAGSPPSPVLSLHRRQNALTDPQVQRDRLAQLDLSHCKASGDFDQALRSAQWPALRPTALDIFQINLGKLCNMTCKHCHVDAGPDRTRENMDLATVQACLRLLDQTTAHTVDLTGGAPELNPHFRYLVDECVRRGKQVIDRCNLTVLLLPGREDLPQWLADRAVEVVCSLPHYRQRNTDAQRGDGTYEKSIEALRRLNTVGYGQGDPRRRLTLVTNPVGALLASNQAKAQQEWQTGLRQNHGVTFDRLIALNNMPISRFLDWLETSGNLQRYMETLTNTFNPGTIEGLMCRNTLSVSWDGRLFDCDFNQMLDLELRDDAGTPIQIQNYDQNSDLGAPTQALVEFLGQRQILTGRHCFGCTAGAGSSCGGAIA